MQIAIDVHASGMVRTTLLYITLIISSMLDDHCSLFGRKSNDYPHIPHFVESDILFLNGVKASEFCNAHK